jgi:hypothetical protein
VAEEIEDVGRSALRSAAPHLVMAVLYDLMVIAWPEAREVPRWRAENRMRHDEARAACAPSMVGRRELDVDELYRRALRGMPETIDGVPPLPVPVDPWFTLAGLLADRA